MALNLHRLKLEGTPFSGNPARMAAVADAVAAEGIAALALQEVCKNTREDAMALLVTELGRATGTEWTGKWIRSMTPGWETPDQAEEGIAVLAWRHHEPTGDRLCRSVRTRAKVTRHDAIGSPRSPVVHCASGSLRRDDSGQASARPHPFR